MVRKLGQDWFMKTIIEVDKQYGNTNFQQKETTE